MMKKTVFAFFRAMMLVAMVPTLTFSLVACEPESGAGGLDDDGDTPSDTTSVNGSGIGEEDTPEDVTSEIAVTGQVNKFGYTYADVSGYANLNLLPAGSGNPVIGVELIETSAESGKNAIQSTASSLIGNIYTVSFDNLSPATEYKYRSFVTYGGITYYGSKYKTFTTREVVDLTSDAEASDVTITSAILSVSVQADSVDTRDNPLISLVWSTSKDAICPDGDYESHLIPVSSMTDCEFSVLLSGLSGNTTYYYASCTEVGGVYVFSSVKSFTTKEMRNLVGEVEISEIKGTFVVLSASVQTEGVDAKDNVCVGLAWSTSRSDLCPNGKFQSRKISVGYVENGVFTISLNNLLEKTTYYCASFTLVGDVYVFSSVREFATDVLRLETGAVDLGLSVKWAGCNVGAESPEEFGDYFAWGETSPKSSYSYDNCVTYGLSFSELESRGIINAAGNLAAEYDAATANWGGSWRMPTLDEMTELRNNCAWEWTTINGVSGRLVTGHNGNSIFLPAAGDYNNTSLSYAGIYGYYLTATLYDNGYSRYYFYFNSSYYNCDISSRDGGLSIRPVTE